MTPELAADTKRCLEDLLSFFGVNANVESETSDDTITLRVTAEGGGRLIGHRGESLAALQHVLNMMVRQRTRERVYVHVDIGGYREARLAKLEEQARQLAQQVREDGTEAALPLMSPAERRHIHAALTDEPGITTESQGEGNRRRLVIKPA